jgi:FkbM family methyltransferase
VKNGFVRLGLKKAFDLALDLALELPALRSLSWRLGRKLYCAARLERENSPLTNGEYWLIERMVEQEGLVNPVLFDIGANVGEWTARALSILDRSGSVGCQIYAFEPTPTTAEHLAARFRSHNSVTVERTALSSHAGRCDLFVVGDLAGTNSLLRLEGAVACKVDTETVDQFATDRTIDHIQLVKSDTEGNDLEVMRGAVKMLQGGRIDAWQFEYNHRWIAAHASLSDVFSLIEDLPYRLGKLHGGGVEIYREWHPELDRYFETNYVLIRKGSMLERLCRTAAFDSNNVPLST